MYCIVVAQPSLQFIAAVLHPPSDTHPITPQVHCSELCAAEPLLATCVETPNRPAPQAVRFAFFGRFGFRAVGTARFLEGEGVTPWKDEKGVLSLHHGVWRLKRTHWPAIGPRFDQSFDVQMSFLGEAKLHQVSAA